MALIIAGDRSGVGKTTITLAILTFLANRGKRVQSFKVGPDYIDPMFHSLVTRVPCRNLDPVLTSPQYIQNCFQRHAYNAEWVVIEGVMGLFDGISNLEPTKTLNDYGSTAHIARILNLPVVLVLDCSRMSTSIAAIAYGYASLDPKVKIAGVILNKVASDRHLELLSTALDTIEMPILGVLRRNAQVTIPDRHLGLIPSGELPNIKHIFSQLADLAQTSFNWDKIFPLISTPSISNSLLPTPRTLFPKVKIAVAKDAAFNFYYQDNLDILTQLGAELINWSPMNDENIPDGIQGLYFGGGFPEVFASQLAENKNVLQQLRTIILGGIPTYAECGGLMYLCQQLIDLARRRRSMVGIIPTTVVMEAKLTLGYRKAIALQDSPLISPGQTITGHEFHRSQLKTLPVKPQWQLQSFHKSSPQLTEGWQINRVHASYLHLHWGEAQHLAQRFLNNCQNYQT
ncbi:cobyrinate a,c-diamide synthase [Waterburya agarophytonicola K14]|uniref:Cobyrinate a,c-diamide synthase n=1 Tax=Waterburya agarophytonicola KI4 TaxID=2874699 RepID=A0A964BNJ3_9CYAN|nr:cobyrinate a,c-diamide synthase [Waterburya agarophytonicola]MCC0176364.1 cobyrinate a,c-diamide synthase [Waterburya agarophytonicola KI4]